MDSINPIGLNTAEYQNLTFNTKMSEEQKLAEASKQFEGVMLRQYLKDALKPLVETELTKDSASSNIYRSYLIDIMAGSMAESGAFGVSSTLQAGIQGSKMEDSEK
ncbi:MAG: hypothetical protein AAF212_04635 [Verrucomicrobiota bacterium]